MEERKRDTGRGYMAFIFVIILGYVIGFFLKKVTLGLVIGLVLGVLGAGLLKRR